MKKHVSYLIKNLTIIVILALAVSCGAIAATNLAINATASASLTNADAANVCDGSMETSWAPGASATSGTWVQLDWSAPQTFNTVTIKESSAVLADFDLVVNGQTYNCKSAIEAAGYSGTTSVSIPLATVSSIKVVLKDAADWGSVSIAEIEVSSADANIAKLATPSTSGGQDWGGIGQSAGWTLIDGRYAYGQNWSDAWIASPGDWGKSHAWVQLSWPNVQSFNEVQVRLGSSFITGSDVWMPASYALSISNDGSHWTPLRSGSYIKGITDGTAIVNVYLPTFVSAQYLRMDLNMKFGGSPMVNEIEVWQRNDPQWAVINGKISDSADGTGVAHARLQSSLPADNSDWVTLYDIDADASGNYTLCVDPGTYSIDVTGPGYVTQTIPVTVAAKEQKNLDISLVPGTWAEFPNAGWSTNTDGSRNEQGLKYLEGSASTPVAAVAGPDQRPCYKFDGGWSGWNVDPAFYQGSIVNGWIDITYLDDHRGWITVKELHSSDPTGSVDAAMIAMEGTGQWVTRTIPYNMTSFMGLGGYDFYVEQDSAVYVSNMAVRFRTPDNFGKLPLDIKFDTTPVSDGLVEVLNNQNGKPISSYQSIPTVMGGLQCHQIAPNGELLLDAPADRYQGVHDVWVKIKYFDTGTDTMLFGIHKYLNAGDGTWREYKLTKHNTNTWKTWTMFIQGVCFNDVNGANLWLYDTAGEPDGPDYIREVTVSETYIPDPNDLKVNDVKNLPTDGGYVTATGIVTYVWKPGLYWIENPDRSSGIRVNMRGNTPYPSVGSYVGVYGYMNPVEWAGPCIDDAQFTLIGTGESLKPLAMTNKTAASNAGLDVGSLYVTIWGTVTDTTTDASGRITIDDGSGTPISVDAWDRSYVQGDNPYSVGDYVVITGTLRTINGYAKTIFTSYNDITKL